MEMFFVYKLPMQGGRIVLDDSIPEEDSFDLISTLSAKNRKDARDQLRPSGFELYNHRPGHGFFEEA